MTPATCLANCTFTHDLSDSSMSPGPSSGPEPTFFPFGERKTDGVSIPYERINELPPEERSTCLHELHGVHEAPQEDPGRMKELLGSLDSHLHKFLLMTPDSAYHRAIQMSPDYVNGLKLMFLRAANYDALRTSHRMTQYFELRLHLFGLQSLARPLSIDDLTLTDRDYLRSGYLQLLPQRDRVGRPVLILFGKEGSDVPSDTTCRISLFFCDRFFRDQSTQLKGVVMVYFGIGQTKYSAGKASDIVKGTMCFPMKIVAYHTCYDNPMLHQLFSFVAYALDRRDIIRLRCHFGSSFECQYHLASFGIPREIMPISPDGSISLLHHNRLMETLQSISDQMGMEADEPKSWSPSQVILLPEPQDVVIGQGKRGIKSPGNQRLKQLLLEHYEQYEVGSRSEKIAIKDAIFEQMVASGTRFLGRSKEHGGWEMVDDGTAKASISHAFRNRRAANKKVKRDRGMLSPRSSSSSPSIFGI